MGQEIKIGVNANTTGVADQIKQVDGATKGLAGSIDAVAKATKAAADGMRQMEALSQRLKGIQSILSKEFGKPIGEADAREFLRNYERIRSTSGIGTRSTRGFDSFENWYQGHATIFRRQADAERARRYVMAVGMQNTGYARENGVPAFPQRQPGEQPPREPVEEPTNFGSSVRRAQSSAMGFGSGFLALAGI